MKPKICVLRTGGTNCDEETAEAFALAGGDPELVHVIELRGGKKSLRDCQILAIPGGFSYGDDIAAGRVLAVELRSRLLGELQEFVSRSGLVLGICNGFQVLVELGLLPGGIVEGATAALAGNDVGHFVCRWVDLLVAPSVCLFTSGLPEVITLQVAHGEGRFVAENGVLAECAEAGQIPLRYALVKEPAGSREINSTTQYPANPNGSVNGIAGLADPSGRIFGLMPHPERFVRNEQYPNWRREEAREPDGLKIFENAVRAAGEL
jgi:phosphoribosylformylglycinamidine synthase